MKNKSLSFLELRNIFKKSKKPKELNFKLALGRIKNKQIITFDDIKVIFDRNF